MSGDSRHLVKEPRYVTVGKLFQDGSLFEVPRYQRAYAWETEHIEDFLHDLEQCYTARLASKPKEHFFGGLVCAETDMPGTGLTRREIIDGQQRIATFALYVSRLIVICERLAEESRSNGEDGIQRLHVGRSSRLRAQFLEQAGERNRELITFPKVTLSAADREFFHDVLFGDEPHPSRASHHLLIKARKLVDGHLDGILSPLAADEKVDAIERLVAILNDDCSLIYIPATSRADAYRLFQVLNDRGESLSAGDLLRAATMELLEGDATSAHQSKAEGLWNDILGDSPAQTEDFLQWYFAAQQGKRPRSESLFDDFMEACFRVHGKPPLSAKAAKAVVDQIADLQDAIRVMRRLVGGEWPYPENSLVAAWDRSRLSLLVQELGHTHCMPLLYAASKLKEAMFADIVFLLERFIFRYKIICNEHIGPASTIYFRQAKAILAGPERFRLGHIVPELKALVEERAADEVFRYSLAQLRYSSRGTNRPLKYMLISLEDHWRWYRQGASGKPKCLDKSRVFDPASTTIEHIYPQNAAGKSRKAALESLKHTLGNLAILGPDDNVKADRKDYEKKRELLGQTRIAMNQELSTAASWTKKAIQDRQEEMINAALRLFSL